MKIKELEEFFNSVELPTEWVRLNEGEVCINAQKMVETHLETLKKNPGNRAFLPYHTRLMKLVEYIKEKQNNNQ